MRIIMSVIALCLSIACLGQEQVLKYWNFESEKDVMKWPDDAVIELDDEYFVKGEKSIVFTPDNNYVAYFYQDMKAGHRYKISCWAKMSAKPIDRVGIYIAYNKANGGNGSAGHDLFSFSKLAPADGEWHECQVEFTAPAETFRAQVQLAMYRTNVEVFIDEFRLFDLNEDVKVEKVQEAGKPVQAAAQNQPTEEKGKIVTTMPPLTTKRPYLPRKQSGYAFSSNIEQIAYVAPGVSTMIHFMPVNPSFKPRLFVALPSEIKLLNGFRDFTVTPIAPREIAGKTYEVYSMTSGPKESKYTFLWRGNDALKEGQSLTGYFWGEWDGGVQEPQQLNIKVVEIPKTDGFKSIPVYLSMPNDFYSDCENLDSIKRSGINYIDIWTYLNKDELDWGLPHFNKTNELAKKAGLRQVAWIREWWWDRAKKSEDGKATKLDGSKTDAMLCLSYRGQYYQELLEQGRMLIDNGYYFQSSDPEMYGAGLDICFCDKCKDGFKHYLAEKHNGLSYVDPVEIASKPKDYPELNRAWCAYKCQRYADFFGDYRKAMEGYMAEKGIKERFVFMVYSSYHRSFPSFEDYPDYRDSHSYLQTLEDPAAFIGVFDILAPMIYTDVYANYGDYDMQLPCRDTQVLRRISQDKLVLAPILCAGYPFVYAFGSDNNAEMLKYNMLEVLAGGGKGFGFWGECPFDANDAKSVAQVVSMLAPYEGIILNGKTDAPVKALSENAIVRRTAAGNYSLVYVSEYSRNKLNVRISCPVAVPSEVRNLSTGKVIGSISPENGEFVMELNDDRVVVLAIVPVK